FAAACAFTPTCEVRMPFVCGSKDAGDRLPGAVAFVEGSKKTKSNKVSQARGFEYGIAYAMAPGHAVGRDHSPDEMDIHDNRGHSRHRNFDGDRLDCDGGPAAARVRIDQTPLHGSR